MYGKNMGFCRETMGFYGKNMGFYGFFMGRIWDLLDIPLFGTQIWCDFEKTVATPSKAGNNEAELEKVAAIGSNLIISGVV